MGNPSTAHEPSMEEILASIRQIISEDSEGTSAESIESAAASEVADDKGDRVAEAERESLAETQSEAVEAVQLPQPEPEPEPASEPEFSPEPFRQNPPERRRIPDAMREEHPPARAPVAAQQPNRASGPGGLLSREQDAAVSGAFGALAHTMLTQNTRTLEDVVEEMLRPMLKGWLDNNLPSLVERLVKDEIERVSRGRR